MTRLTLMIAGGVAAATLVLAFLLARLLRKRKRKKPVVSGTPELGAPDSPATRASLAASKAEQELADQLAEREALQQKSDAQVLTNLKLAPVITKKAEVLAKHLRERITREPDVAAQVLRTWIREEEQ